MRIVFFSSINNLEIDDFAKSKRRQQFNLNDLGQLKHCLGIKVHIDKNEKSTFDQEQYADTQWLNMICMQIKRHFSRNENAYNAKMPY